MPWLLLNLWNTGSPVPGTVVAKLAWFAERDLPVIVKAHWVGDQLVGFLRSFGVFTLLAAALIWRSGPGIAGVAFACVLVSAYFMDLPGAFGHYRQRYLFVLAPVLILGAAMTFRYMRPAWQAGLAALLLLQSVWFAHLALGDLERDRAFTVNELEGLASWVRSNLPKEAVLLVHDAGFIAWGTKFRIVDLVGLKTPGSIPEHRQHTLPSAGKNRGLAISRIAARARATHLVLLDGWDKIFHIRKGLADQGWKLEPLRTEGQYKVFRLTGPLPDVAGGQLNNPCRSSPAQPAA